MRAKNNKGSSPTKASIKSAAQTSMGAKKSIRTKSASGSYEGYQYAQRADIISNTSGYLAPNAQRARLKDRNPVSLDTRVPDLDIRGFYNPTAMSNVGFSPRNGSAGILMNRIKLNGV